MAWPTPQDYNEAIQNPKLAFADPDLQVGYPELTPLGLPRPITGGFASVYKLQGPQRTWAVRCFLRQFHDLERRYAAISEQLTRLRLPYTVGFTFLRDGIRVRGQSYPILKMEWVQGEPLSTFVEKHLGNRSTLLSLGTRWIEMLKALQQASIAHGDLQHGNVLVVDGQLRLIDYDGMYVPALSGQGSHEVGHRNYQHPLRTESDFGPYLDNFSAWVVYVSLIALAADPGLWKQFGGGDETLLFRRRDFEQPEVADIFRTLERHREEQIQSAIALFKSLLFLGPRDVPSLDGQIAPPVNLIITCEGCGQALRVPADRGPGRIRCPRCGLQKDWSPPRSNGSDWVRDHLGNEHGRRRESATDEQDKCTKRPEPNPSWILDDLDPSGPTLSQVTFTNSVAVERLFVGFSAIGTLLLTGAAQAGAMGLSMTLLGILLVLVALANVAFWACRFRLEKGVVHSNALKSRLKSNGKQIRANVRAIEAMEKERRNISERKAADEARLGKEQKAAEAKEKEDIDGYQAVLQSALSSINDRRQKLNQQEAEAVRKIHNDIGAKVSTLNGQISALAQAESTELANTLRGRQEQHLATYLRQSSLRSASISGVGPAFTDSLLASGFHTAADVNFYAVRRVYGIGPVRAKAIVDWKRSLEMRARSTMPSALPQSEATAIRAKFEGQHRALEAQRDQEQRRQRDEEEKIRAHYRPLSERLNEEENDANAKTQAEISEIRARYAQQYRAILETLSTLPDDTASKCREVDARIAEGRKKLFSLHWEKEKLRWQLKPYEGIRFSKYLKRVFFGSKAV